MPDENHILGDEIPLVTKDGILDITPKWILQTRERILRNKSIIEHLVKWTGYPKQDASWEREDSLIQSYLDFFSR